GVTVERIATLETEAGGFLPACRLALERNLLKSAAAEKVEKFLVQMDAFRAALPTLPYPQLTARIIEETGYGAMLREDPTEQAQERMQNLEELLRGMEEYAGSAKTLEEYLEQVALVTDLDTYDG